MSMKRLQVLVLALAVSAAACSDSTSPGGGPTRSITVNLCNSLAPGSWFAYQNEGGPWVQATANGSGQITFDATEKVSVATAISFFGIAVTDIINATATELEGTASASCEGDFGDFTMAGTVVGLTGEQFAQISAGTASDGATSADPGWLLEDLPGKALDLIATRYATFSTQPAQRVVVRRAVTPANAAVPPLDFAGAESGALESAIATFNNIPVNGSLSVGFSVQTASGTNVDLGDLTSMPASSSQAVSYVSLPASLRIASDMHAISASGYNATATNTLVHYYKTPAAKTLAFGPILSAPTVTNAVTSPIVRPRVQLASQSEYGAATIVDFSESVGEDSHYVTILTTAGFTGGLPDTWDITVPDMSSGGYDPDWALKTTSYNWSATAYGVTGGAGVLTLTAQPVDGLTVISSTRGKVEVIGLGSAGRRAGARRLSPLLRGRR